MASISNTSITSCDYLLRNCYSINRSARKAITRTTLKNEELVKADSSALKKITTNLKNLEYDGEHGKSIYNSLKVFVDSYNNLLDSSDKVLSPQLQREMKKLTKFVKNNKDDLEELGLKVSSSGKITLKDSTLLATSASKIGKTFSSSSDFTSTIAKYATKVNRFARNLQLSGSSANQATTENPNVPPITTNSIEEAIMTANAIDYRA